MSPSTANRSPSATGAHSPAGAAFTPAFTPARAKLVLLLAAFVALAGAVTALALGVPPEARPLTIALGTIVAVVLFAHLLTNEPNDIAPILTIAGMALVLAALGTGVVAAAITSVLLLAFTEIAAMRAVVARLPERAVVDVHGRARECAAAVLVGAGVAAVAAAGSLVDVPGQLVAVALAAVAVAAIGKVIATRALG
jgi:hypothetical protein